MARGRSIGIEIVIIVLVVFAALYLSGFLVLRTDSVTINVNSESPWTGEITINGDGRRYVDALSIFGNESAQYSFERPEGVKKWEIMVKAEKTTSELTELEVIIYDNINKKYLVWQETLKPYGHLEVSWSG